MDFTDKSYYIFTAVVDLNGRFFGGREVQARFYEQDRFTNLSLYD